jgi:phage terminase large subunit-like protein
MENGNLIEDADIVKFIKAQRIKLLVHIQRIDKARPTRMLLDWKPMGTRPVGKSRQQWQKCHGRSKKVESQKLERGS